jgi:Protein export membrane protein/SecD/SecF GG Motif
MLAIFVNTSYDFIGKRRWAYAVSVAVMLLGLVSILLKGGLQYDIDFTGGTLVEMRLAKPTPIGVIRSRLTAVGLGDSVIQVFDNPRDVLIRSHLSHGSATEMSRRIAGALDPDRTGAPEVRRVDVVGAQIGSELRTQALYAVLAALAGILLYIWWRFDFRGGVVTILYRHRRQPYRARAVRGVLDVRPAGRGECVAVVGDSAAVAPFAQRSASSRSSSAQAGEEPGASGLVQGRERCDSITRTETVAPAHSHQSSMSRAVRLARTQMAIPANAPMAKTQRRSVRTALGGVATSTTASTTKGENAAP